MSDITLLIYSSGTTLISENNNELTNMSGLWYETGYPGGRYLAGGCYIPRVPQDWWEINSPLRAVVKSGQTTVYEGIISSYQHQMSSGGMGVQLNFTGFWGWVMLNRSMRKRWADDRVDEQTWASEISTLANNNADLGTVSRDQRLYMLPKAEQFAASEFFAVNYELKGNGTIVRVSYTVDFKEAAQSWGTALYRSTDGTSWTQMTAGSGETYNTGSTTVITADTAPSTDIDVEPAGTPTWLQFRFYNDSGGNQTPTSDGTYYAKITDLVVYTEDEGATGINLDSIATDIIGDFSDVLNSDTSNLDASSNVRAVEPFITQSDNYEALGDVLMRMAGFGDSNDDRYAVGVLASDKAATPNGLPVLFTQDYPDTSAGHDYFLSLADDRIIGNVNITRDFDSIVNIITVTYRDERGWQQIVTSNDDGGLTDATSVADYGNRAAHLNIGNSTSADAINYGTRFIQRWKDPRWVVNGSIKVIGSIDTDTGSIIPASRVEAGQRIKIDGYDTFVVSRTRYDADTEIVEISVDNPDIMVYNDVVFDPIWNDPIPNSVTGSGSMTGGSGVSTDERLGWHDLKKADRAEYQRRKRLVLAYRRKHGGSLKQAKRALGW